MTNSIFISYRRNDSKAYAGRLNDDLSDQFGPDQIFMDIEAIGYGADFVEVLQNAVGSCDVLITVIGPQWLNITDAEGKRRLDRPNDFVRLEVVTALERGIPVIPVLVNGAQMPSEQELPDGLKGLARRNALEISDLRWRYDVGRLIETLHKLLDGKKSTQLPVLDWPVAKKRSVIAGVALAVIIVAAAGYFFLAGEDTTPEIMFFVADPAEVVKGEVTDVELEWSVAGPTTDVEISNADQYIPMMKNLAPEGSIVVAVDIDDETLFILTAYNDEDSESAAVIIEAMEPGE